MFIHLDTQPQMFEFFQMDLFSLLVILPLSRQAAGEPLHWEQHDDS